jgi:regulator of replication initiation timing
MATRDQTLEKMLDYAIKGLNESHENFKRLLDDAKKLADEYDRLKAENEQLRERLKEKE